MKKYFVTRVVYMFFVVFIVVTITFFIIHLIPGDPITATVEDLPLETKQLYLEKYGYDQPVHIQYVKFLKGLLKGDFGQSVKYPGRSVIDIVRTFAPVSLILGSISLALGWLIGSVLGIVAAYQHNLWIDKSILILAILGTSIPTFAIAASLQYVFSVIYPIFPTTGWGTMKHAVLPLICLVVDPIATYARYMRSTVLDVLSQNYITTARSKGLPNYKIILNHVMRNAFLPIIPMFCVSVSTLFYGSFIVESIFAIPGLGKYFISSINDRDYSVVLGLNLFMTLLYISSVLLSDVLLATLDPRIRFVKSGE